MAALHGLGHMGAYVYGRPHVGYQALMANALLTYTNALGYVTELLSGDSMRRSAARRIPGLVRGDGYNARRARLFGIEISAGAKSCARATVPADGIDRSAHVARRRRYDLS